MAVVIHGIPPGSVLDEMVQAYFTALADRDYRTARVSLFDLAQRGSPGRTLPVMLRLTYEMEPSSC